MVKIVDNFSYNNNYYPERNKRKYITIHETTNTGVGADADAHANFMNQGNIQIEIMYFIKVIGLFIIDDRKQIKWQVS